MEMVVPEVSHRNWERTRALTQISMGTFKVDAESLSFSRQLSKLVVDGRAFMEELEEKESGQSWTVPEGADVVHGQWENGVRIEYYPESRSRSHRPEVPDSVAEELRSAVRSLYPGVPVDEIGFDKALGMFLDELKGAYAQVGCYCVPAEVAEKDN